MALTKIVLSATMLFCNLSFAKNSSTDKESSRNPAQAVSGQFICLNSNGLQNLNNDVARICDPRGAFTNSPVDGNNGMGPNSKFVFCCVHK